MAVTVPNRNNWNFNESADYQEYDFKRLVSYYMNNMYNRCLMMFKWDNLPDDMDSFDMEKFLIVKGATFFLYDKEKKRYFTLVGSEYDNITWNYEPSKSIIVNPALPTLPSKYKLGENCVMIRNDYRRIGLYDILEKNAMDIANTDISIRYAQFNTRFKSLFTSDDDNTKETLDALIDDIWQGKKPSAIVTTNLYKKSIESVGFNVTQQNDILSLIELRQYQMANWYIELCINANYNMKRESLNENEINMNDDALLPLIDQMLECRKKACDEINKLFDLNISVELTSSWKKIHDEIKLEMKKEKIEVENIEEPENNDDKGGDNNVDAEENKVM